MNDMTIDYIDVFNRSTLSLCTTHINLFVFFFFILKQKQIRTKPSVRMSDVMRMLNSLRRPMDIVRNRYTHIVIIFINS